MVSLVCDKEEEEEEEEREEEEEEQQHIVTCSLCGLCCSGAPGLLLVALLLSRERARWAGARWAGARWAGAR